MPPGPLGSEPPWTRTSGATGCALSGRSRKLFEWTVQRIRKTIPRSATPASARWSGPTRRRTRPLKERTSKAAVDGKGLTADIPGAVGGEEADDVAELLRR